MNDEGKVLLNKELYELEMILYAVEQYDKLASIKVVDKEIHWECQFSRCVYATNLTMKEFENYIINIENARL